MELVREYYKEAFPRQQFVPGESHVSYAGRVFDAEESGAGRFVARFLAHHGPLRRRGSKREFARCFGMRERVLSNSGSSANLLAVSALTSPKLGDRRLMPGDEVITVAAGFPTTVNPIIQNGWCPCSSMSLFPLTTWMSTQLEAALSDGPARSCSRIPGQSLRSRSGDGVRHAGTTCG